MSFTSWHQYQEILTLCHLVVNTRPNYPIEQLNKTTKALLCQHQASDITELSQDKSGRIYFAKACFFDISSTQIRQHLAQKQSGHLQLQPEISEFIHKNKLYR